ncbi:hypothetical protein GCM10027290_05460 [Micromonospora sonneratiae]|uniref:CsbD family protein n=1 Tax=Micromonospora sonneratiae TaxID=1184706 RepID=A0ABW3YN91_9ACTN
MSLTDKAKAKAEELMGGTKERTGEATGKEQQQQGEHPDENIGAKAKQAGKHAMEAGREAKDMFKR